jgi:hypothetical protein
LLAAIVFVLAGCEPNDNSGQPSNDSAAKPTPTTTVQESKLTPTSKPASEAKTAAPVAVAPMSPPIRISAGNAVTHTNANGDVWLADMGFDGGDTVERAGDLQIANTDMPEIYRTEHHSMNSFSMAVPNGKYTVKLHFAETFHGITAPGERIFSFSVKDKDFKDFDVFAKAGGANRAYVETITNVDVTDGRLDITFKSSVQNPEINGIEIIPKS